MQQQYNKPLCLQGKNVPIAKKLESQRTGFMAAMSDSGLKPTVVYHNLTPAELYEKVKMLDNMLSRGY